MTWIRALQDKTGDAVVAAARRSQALVIETLDRAAGGSERRTVRFLHRVGRLQLELGSLILDDPAQFVDDRYALLQRLVSLHREFAQRLFEVLDPGELPAKVASDAVSGRVLPFPTKRTSTS